MHYLCANSIRILHSTCVGKMSNRLGGLNSGRCSTSFPDRGLQDLPKSSGGGGSVAQSEIALKCSPTGAQSLGRSPKTPKGRLDWVGRHCAYRAYSSMYVVRVIYDTVYA